ncbi:TetR/AcrR family transcriptional regulator [Winogradskya consettensis]|uniref:TetR family transcriptional regulator n=1 Tax=Winogradskya consettensis TaxID=113560 RepID=A0A919SXF0_9ACTN|nr:TetR/AcrR family transcriptional regulator [Actinoplanes consettensis]GIM79191.1 TetR family transcriptional regulator [Actinoplanes consettensis]
MVNPGRKRDHSRDADILQATLDVLAETSYADLTIEMVAARAGAGRGTIYRRWTSKDELILAAVACADQGGPESGEFSDTGSLRGDLLAMLDPDWLGSGERRMRILSSLTAMMGRTPDAFAAVSQAIVEPSVAVYQHLIQRAVDRGEFAKSADVAALAQLIPAMATYRALFMRLPVELPFFESMIDGVLIPALESQRSS